MSIKDFKEYQKNKKNFPKKEIEQKVEGKKNSPKNEKNLNLPESEGMDK
jgi:hypothetical protein